MSFRPNRHYTWLLIATAALISGCSADEVDFGRKKDDSHAQGAQNATPQNQEIDMQAQCGLPKEAMSNPGTQIFQENLQSLPIVVTGSQMVDYVVTTQATVNIVSQSDQVMQNISVQVLDVKTSSNILGIPMAVAKSKANDAAEAKSGTITTTRLSNGAWLNLTTDKTKPEYNSLFCAVAGSSKIQNNTGDQSGTVEFTPALVNAINPLAPRATLDKEIPLNQPKVFQVTAKITGNRKDWSTGTQQGTVTITQIPASTQVGGQTVAGDIAYEVKADFPNGAIKVGISRNQKFFLNTKTHTFEAIIDDSGALDPQSGALLPPTILMRH